MSELPFIDLKRLPPELLAAQRNAVLRVLEHRRFILGEEVRAFEEGFAALLGGVPVVGCSSGTDALLLGLMALDVGPGDVVLTTPFSFFATAGVIARLGATPGFVDIEPEHFEMDATLLEGVPRDAVKVVVPVHLFGHTMDIDPVLRWAGGEVAVLEDAAQAVMSRDARGRPAGTLGDLGAFSFFPTKNLGALGDAGALAVGARDLEGRVRGLRVHGQRSSYVHEEVGGNFRLDAVQAAALAASLAWLEELTSARRRNAEIYDELLRDTGLAETGCSWPRPSPRHTFHQFVVRIPGGRRDAVREGMLARGVATAVYYPLPLHLQPCFRGLELGPGAFPEAERAAREVLALPIHPGLERQDVERVVEALAAETLGR